MIWIRQAYIPICMTPVMNVIYPNLDPDKYAVLGRIAVTANGVQQSENIVPVDNNPIFEYLDMDATHIYNGRSIRALKYKFQPVKRHRLILKYKLPNLQYLKYIPILGQKARHLQKIILSQEKQG